MHDSTELPFYRAEIPKRMIHKILNTFEGQFHDHKALSLLRDKQAPWERVVQGKSGPRPHLHTLAKD